MSGGGGTFAGWGDNNNVLREVTVVVEGEGPAFRNIESLGCLGGRDEEGTDNGRRDCFQGAHCCVDIDKYTYS